MRRRTITLRTDQRPITARHGKGAAYKGHRDAQAQAGVTRDSAGVTKGQTILSDSRDSLPLIIEAQRVQRGGASLYSFLF